MKTFCRWPVIALSILTLAVTADAAQWGVRAGSYRTTSKPFAGLELVMPLGPLSFDPNVEYVFQSGYRLATLNADFTYHFGDLLWVGAGPALIYSSGAGIHESKAGANVLFGAGWKTGFLNPYVQAKEIFARNSSREFVIGAGIRF